VWRALSYHAAGGMLLVGLVAAGVMGAIRLVRRDPRAARLPFKWTTAIVLGWVVLYLVQWALRLTGRLALP